MSNNGPTFTKATYDGKRPRRDPPSPAKRQAALSLEASEAARTRHSLEILHRDGFDAWWADLTKQKRPGG